MQRRFNSTLLTDSNGNPLRFLKTELEFHETNQENEFASLRSRTLSYTILQEKYEHLAAEVRDKYSSFLNQSLPDFLSTLKRSGDPFYKRFLNPYGDKLFCKFRMASKEVGDGKGLYLYKLANRIMYVGKTTASFYRRINAEYGNISPKNCYRDGQETNCHVNSLINGIDRSRLSLWICVFDDITELKEIEKYFIRTLLPPWNLALKPMRKSNCLYLTHCSDSKNPNFKSSMDATTPDVLYTSDRIELFFDYVKKDDLPWAIFSDKYGFVFPSSTIQWYDYTPDAVTEADIVAFLKDSIDELREYEKIIYRAGKKPIHRTYERLIETMRSSGLTVVIVRE